MGDDALRGYRNLALLAVLSLAACAADHPTKSIQPPVDAAAADKTPDSAVAIQQLTKSRQLIADKNWPEAIKALQTIIDAESFGRLPSDIQYSVLMTAGRTALGHGPPKLAFGYLTRATAMPQSDFDDWHGRLRAAEKLGNEADLVSTLTVLIRRWPDRSSQFDPEEVARSDCASGCTGGNSKGRASRKLSAGRTL
jgi:hypothetical protein